MKKKKFSVGLLFVYLVLVIWALTTIYPLIWVVMNSFKAVSYTHLDVYKRQLLHSSQPAVKK